MFCKKHGRRTEFLGGLATVVASCALIVVIAGGTFVYLDSRGDQDETKPAKGYEEGVRETGEVVKESTKAPSESQANASASAEPDITAVLVAYQQYLDGVTDRELYGFDMAYINDDDVPECIVWLQGGVRVLSYTNNTLKTFSPSSAGGGSAEVAYTSRTGEFAVTIRYGRAGHDYSLVELRENFKIQVHAEANGEPYEINGETVDDETYLAQTDLSRFQKVLDTYGSDSVLSAYNALISTEPPAV